MDAAVAIRRWHRALATCDEITLHALTAIAVDDDFLLIGVTPHGAFRARLPRTIGHPIVLVSPPHGYVRASVNARPAAALTALVAQLGARL